MKSKTKYQYTTFICLMLLHFILLSNCNKGFNDKDQTYKELKTVNPGKVNWIGHWKGEGNKEQMVREIANEFEFLNQDIKVNLQFPEDIYKETNDNDVSYAIKMITSPNPQWDIIRLKNNYFPISIILKDPDWGKKYLVDFSEMQDFVNNQIPLVFDQTFKSQNGGITIGPYSEGYFYSIWYNVDLADKIGIKIKDFGMTPQDFVSYIKAAYDYNKKNNTEIIPLFEAGNWLTTENLMMSLFYSLFSNYNEIIDVEFKQEKLAYLEKVLRIFEEISQYEPLPKNRVDITFEQTMDYPLNGKCLLYVNASWMYNDWENIDKSKLLKMFPAEMPSFSAKSPCYNGGYQACWAVLKNAPNRENAIKLMKFWTRAEIAEKWVRYTKSPTAVKGSLTSVTLGLDQFENFEYAMTAKYGANLLVAYDNRYLLGLKNKDVKIPFIDIMNGKISVDQAMLDIKKQLKQ